MKRDGTPELSQSILREYFKYKLGFLIWIKNSGNKNRIGTVAGCIPSPHGYSELSLNKNRILLHRAIWIYHNGDIPINIEIDHIDRDTLNNSIQNLRLANRSTNVINTNVRYDSSSGIKGVMYCPSRTSRKKWKAQISNNSIRKTLGYFEDMDDAITARFNAEKEIGVN